jgi:hypothetical protein
VAGPIARQVMDQYLLGEILWQRTPPPAGAVPVPAPAPAPASEEEALDE